MNWKSCGHLPAARSCFAIVPINSDKLFLTRALLQTKTENKKAFRGCGVGPMYGEVQVKQVLTCLRGGVGLGLYTEGVRLGTCIDGWRDQGPVQGPPRQKDTTENNTFPQLVGGRQNRVYLFILRKKFQQNIKFITYSCS